MQGGGVFGGQIGGFVLFFFLLDCELMMGIISSTPANAETMGAIHSAKIINFL